MEHIKEITPSELQKLRQEDENLVIIDVREDDEVAGGMIKNAKHIALQHIPYEKDKLDKTKHYVFVCRSGKRSMAAAAFMDEHGFNVCSLAGGMLEWDGEVIV